eukprot:3659867-Prymnesium_polylepis.1
MGSSYPTTTPPGRFRRPRRNGVVMLIASVQAGGIRGGSTHAHPSAVARPASSRHCDFLARPRNHAG